MQSSMQFEPRHIEALDQLKRQLGLSGLRFRSRLVQSLIERASVLMAPENSVIADKVAEIRELFNCGDKTPQDIIFDALVFYANSRKEPAKKK